MDSDGELMSVPLFKGERFFTKLATLFMDWF